jgi:glucuronokinase
MILETRAYARAGLIGNPSDGYFGKTISVVLGNFSARVLCYESPRLTIVGQQCDRTEFEGLEALREHISRHGYYGGVRLIKAALQRFSTECSRRGIALPQRHCTLEYATNIPVRVGLAGSSAIVTATLRALMAFYRVDIPRPELPNLILSVERDELGIGAGLQDRVVQVYGGAVFMDFERAHMDQHGYGRYESLDPMLLPPLFVAFQDHLAEGTELTHNPLRERYNRGEREVLDAVATWAGLAQQARDVIVAGRGGEIGPLMNENFDLRARVVHISAGNRRLIEIGRELGAATKFAGSGGAVIGSYDGDPERLARLRQAYEAFGATLIEPLIQV